MKIDAAPPIEKPVIVLGAGSHARVLVMALARLDARVLGLTDSDPTKTGTSILGAPVLGDDTIVGTHSPESVLLVNGIGAIGQTEARRDIHDRFSARGYRFATVVDPMARIAGPAEFAIGAQVLAGATVQLGARIGANSIINTNASVDHDCVIGAHVHIAPGATLSGGVHVGDGAHIGTGASVIQNIRIGAASVVGAGASVVRDLPDGVNAGGVPARILSLRMQMKNWRDTLIGPATSLAEAIRSLDRAAQQICLVVDSEERLLGTITDGDIRRAILQSLKLDTSVADVMNRHPITAFPGTDRDTLLDLMASKSIRNIPLVDKTGRALGLIDLGDLVRSVSDTPGL